MTVLKAGAICFLAGSAIGTLAAWASWAISSHEHRYRITRGCPA